MFEATFYVNDVETIVFVDGCVDNLDVEDKLLEMGFASRTVATAIIKELA